MRLVLVLMAVLLPLHGATAETFADVLARARGQTVYFNAWGGSPQINDYIAWVGRETKARFDVGLVQVKLGDTAEAVARVLAEKEAGRTEGGTVDLLWINGENFRAMKEKGLLFGPFTDMLPNFRLVDTGGKPTTLVDFTIPTDGYESPWGMAKFVLFYDSARVPDPPASLDELAAWTLTHPGRFTYPAPPDFIGSTFLKHVLYEAVPDPARLQQPVDADAFAALATPVWRWLDRVQPHLWRGGVTYPASGQALHRLLDDGEVDFSMAFNPAEASSLILAGRLPESVRSFVFRAGTIANTHFVAIPFNAAHKEGAMVVANFLLEPEAQARKQDVRVWGDPTVLDLAALSPADRVRFEGLALGPATLPPDRLGPALPEPHPSWMELLERGWAERYAR
ncbi:ABC transporter substrate-binding protein [Benzoatithermus flavus]|uniref:ABC transporter substrate-binding protein n=1 Tax=Benzoatithermus flavus TaxID=3108223 RepID=A0ABU8XV74_9PROT